jgi:1-deoxy-D-xylulose-5-phosphate reductoisomerase
MKKFVILGSTGSLGTQCLEVLKKYPKEFKVFGLVAHTKKEDLDRQKTEFKVMDRNAILASSKTKKQIEKLMKTADIVINLISGVAGIEPSKYAVKNGKVTLIANKESLIAEGWFFKKYLNKIIPVDSEHNAIYEILKKFPNQKIKSIILPCSGGPFWGKSKQEIAKITLKQALNHPRWKMGPKVTIESATLINKGLEVVEAHYLFGLPLNRIKVKIHRECMIHGVVEFENGQKYAYISPPDMREHIENALLRAIGKSAKRKIEKLDIKKYKLEELKKDFLPGIETVLAHFKKSPKQMRKFLEKEEKTIQKFLNGKIKFTDIYKILKK